MTTTGDLSSLKTSSHLSGGDLVSRLLAATPPYLYNVPLTSHSFFFSEMLRSFVHSKPDSSLAAVPPPPPPPPSSPPPLPPPGPSRRRKRSWRDSRDRTLELTPKCQNSQQTQNFFRSNDKCSQHGLIDNMFGNESSGVKPPSPNNGVNPNFFPGILESVDENRSDFAKQTQNFFDDSSQFFRVEQISRPHDSSSIDQEVEPEFQITLGRNRKNVENYPETSQKHPTPEKKKEDYPTRNFLPTTTRMSENIQKGSNMVPPVSNSELVHNSPWYPPYPFSQAYPGIDPLHFFIDLRVSGHIWDRKLNEQRFSFKSKHHSAFKVPQTRDYDNRPLNLTRSETNSSRTEQNSQGTNSILRNLGKTYADIKENESDSKTEEGGRFNNTDEVADRSENEAIVLNPGQDSEKHNTDDLRELIGLELVVDYVEDPKEDVDNFPENK